MSKRDIATVSERSDHKGTTIPDVLIGVRFVEIANVNPAVSSLLMDAVAQLRLPLKAVTSFNTSVDELRDHIATVDINCDQCDDLLAVTLCQFSVDQVRQVIQLHLALIVVILARVVVAFLELVEHSVHIICVDDTGHENCHLRTLVLRPLVTRLVFIRLVAVGLVPAQGGPHPFHDLVKPDLNRPFTQQWLMELHKLFCAINHSQRHL